MGALLNRRRYMGGGGGYEPLPPGAVQVEYIQFNSSNSLSLSLDFVPDGNTKIEIDWAVTNKNNRVIFGTASSSDSNDYRLFWHTANNQIYFDIGNGRVYFGMGIYYGLNERFKVELGNLYIKLPEKDYTKTGTAVTYTPYDDSPVGVRNTCIIYGIKAYSGNTPLRDCIPVRIEQKGYLYDKVYKVLYEALNNYTIGPDV